MAIELQVVTRSKQDVEAWINHLGIKPEEIAIKGKKTLVVDYGEIALIQNSKRDAWYTTTKQACSCPDYIYRGGRNGTQCKHQAALFKEQPKPREDARPKMMSLRETIWAAEQEDRNRSCARAKVEAI